MSKCSHIEVFTYQVIIKTKISFQCVSYTYQVWVNFILFRMIFLTLI